MSDRVFLVTFEHAQRSFKCVLIDWSHSEGHTALHWVVTVAGRTVWSFAAKESDTRQSVQRQVVEWWNASPR